MPWFRAQAGSFARLDPSLAGLMDRVRVIGAGLAGCEAAWQLLQRGLAVELREQKPARRTPAQTSDRLAELVCSNSLRSANPENAVGLLKEELSHCGSLLLRCAHETRVPAGDALAVDRERFAAAIEGALLAHPALTLVRGEVTALPADDVPTIVATGPLTGDALAAELARLCGSERLAFFDAIAPIVEADSVLVAEAPDAPPGAAFFLSRWGKGLGSDYLNCPLDKEQYLAFLAALREADRAVEHVEDAHYFEGCLPIEVMAERGDDTLRFGPLKPVGLDDPRTGRWPYAVVQLRKEDVHGTAYNLVGCQTRLMQGAQRAVFGLVPALATARFLRFGAIHRNTYLDAPAVLDDRNALRGRPTLFFAGQITGVEGYVESIASGLLTALVVADGLAGRALEVPPATTALGGLWRHARGTQRAHGNDAYVPSNVTWAMIPPVDEDPLAPGQKRKKLGKGEKRARLVARARRDLDAWWRAR
ncbi:MAG: methylenetetrahydrofolate--tRNA-(uracil(54)-C(5))-methyltransferase (FADH(2)-oxidizing) TrmFO [Deltaproteobacteria bacterium]|nr:methylenetetrahydrofolate--tRNA-(uracil(54)-C(5))-methyltransferase (FADH(2)-oxidizing) TrmFO [Deltaproteobacteria bacterium]